MRVPETDSVHVVDCWSGLRATKAFWAEPGDWTQPESAGPPRRQYHEKQIGRTLTNDRVCDERRPARYSGDRRKRTRLPEAGGGLPVSWELKAVVRNPARSLHNTEPERGALGGGRFQLTGSRSRVISCDFGTWSQGKPLSSASGDDGLVLGKLKHAEVSCPRSRMTPPIPMSRPLVQALVGFAPQPAAAALPQGSPLSDLASITNLLHNPLPFKFLIGPLCRIADSHKGLATRWKILPYR